MIDEDDEDDEEINKIVEKYNNLVNSNEVINDRAINAKRARKIKNDVKKIINGLGELISKVDQETDQETDQEIDQDVDNEIDKVINNKDGKIVKGNDELAYYLKGNESKFKEISMILNIRDGCCPFNKLNLDADIFCHWKWWKDEYYHEEIPVAEIYEHFIKRHFSLEANSEDVNLAHMIIEKLFIIFKNSKSKQDQKRKNFNMKCIALRELNKDVGLPLKLLADLFHINAGVIGDMLYNGMMLKGKPTWVKNVESTLI